jgi:hypothetical protein
LKFGENTSDTAVSFVGLSENRCIRIVGLQHRKLSHVNSVTEVCSECLDVLSTDCIEIGYGIK